MPLVSPHPYISYGSRFLVSNKLEFLVKYLYMDKTTHTKDERNKIVKHRANIIKTYRKRKSVLNQLVSMHRPSTFCHTVFLNDYYTFQRVDNHSMNGWIHLFCNELEKTVSCRYCDEKTMYICSKSLFGKYNQKVFLISNI